jgi:hypothetical protein
MTWNRPHIEIIVPKGFAANGTRLIGTRVFLDGYELAGVHSLELQMKPEGPAIVRLDLMALGGLTVREAQNESRNDDYGAFGQ